MKRVITVESVERAYASGVRSIAAPAREAIVTPSALTRAHELGVVIEESAAPPRRPTGDQFAKPKRTPDPGACEREVDPSGALVVRGKSVRLGEFTGAGADKRIGLTDLVTGRDGSPMTAGIMSWSREDSFPWHLTYDEIDLVLEGVLHVVIDGRTLEARAGDTVFIPKGSRITFATPSRTKVFYVTYPADWAQK